MRETSKASAFNGSFATESFQLLDEFIVGGLDQNGLVWENDHWNHDLSAVRFPDEDARFVVFVDVDPRVRHTVLVEETSRSSSVRAPGCAVNDKSFVRGTHVNDPPERILRHRGPDISARSLFQA